MSNTNSQDQLISFALTELNKVLSDLKEGKEPQVSSSVEKLVEELETANTKKKNMSEEEIKEFADRLVKNISNLDE